jgi:hypothetical protein
VLTLLFNFFKLRTTILKARVVKPFGNVTQSFASIKLLEKLLVKASYYLTNLSFVVNLITQKNACIAGKSLPQKTKYAFAGPFRKYSHPSTFSTFN